ncbi:hypothetical protein HUZ36_16730 [Pseudoalteromonas sp. McH1-7]|uniref:hypothetical protein n=1 Tax=Pseudoalteromonas sp. McH1-7 TaxID=2745574 RepID=UPI001592341C|nr:hypothetical protein [Pseudoalteromonas sp. McH1-7]NUZ12431.1 hypothetical protein [Pseudoalteromonas sp. McH1-7]
MNLLKFKTVVAASLVALSGVAQAEVELVFKSGLGQQSFKIKGHTMRMDNAAQYQLFDALKNKLYVVTPTSKSYMEMSNNMFGDLSALLTKQEAELKKLQSQEGLKNVAHLETAKSALRMAEQQIKQLKSNGNNQLKKLNQRARINGISCELYEFSVAMLQQQVCFADIADIGLSAQHAAVFNRYQQYVGSLSGYTMPTLENKISIDVSPLGSLPGQQSSSQFVRVKEVKFPAKQFSIDPSYKNMMDIPALSRK